MRKGLVLGVVLIQSQELFTFSRCPDSEGMGDTGSWQGTLLGPVTKGLSQIRVNEQGEVVSAPGLAGHRAGRGEQLHCASLVLYILLSFYRYFAFLSSH